MLATEVATSIEAAAGVAMRPTAGTEMLMTSSPVTSTCGAAANATQSETATASTTSRLRGQDARDGRLFRVIAELDLAALRDNARKPQHSIRRLENEGLIRRSPLDANDRAVVLTDRGRDLLKANR